MIEYQRQLDTVFAALADPTRRSLLTRLAEGPATVSELAAPFDVSLQAVSKHLKVLEQAGLVSRSVQGRVHRLSARPDQLRTAIEWVQWYRNLWDANLERLGAFLESPEASGSIDPLWHEDDEPGALS